MAGVTMTEHGTTLTYDDGCRCPACTQAHTVRVAQAQHTRLQAAVHEAISAITPTDPPPTPPTEEPNNDEHPKLLHSNDQQEEAVQENKHHLPG